MGRSRSQYISHKELVERDIGQRFWNLSLPFDEHVVYGCGLYRPRNAPKNLYTRPIQASIQPSPNHRRP
ncbi:hypothetical protein GTR04_2369 [Trichophyton interdigitale]|nr:hypothetical protein GTR04_2369 [Trichophyton interdigitale]